MALIHDETSRQIIDIVKKLVLTKELHKITVRDVLHELQLTNRVFYNRFHNIDEVFAIIYRESIEKVRESLLTPWDGVNDFGEHLETIAMQTLRLIFESRRTLSPFLFDNNNVSSDNFVWWNQEIQKLLQTGKQVGYLRDDLEDDAISYSIWCFIRGFGADAMARSLPEEEALRLFACGLRGFLHGICRT